MNRYYYDDGGNRTKLVHMNAVYSKDGNGRIVSMLTKASASTQGLTKTYLYANFTELTKMTASEYGGTTRDYTYEHDNAGRLTRQVQNVFSPNSTTTYNYEWDALDRMTKVQRVASGVTKTINYTYNGAGLRVRRVDTSTSVTKLWTYAGNNIASVSTKSGGSFGDTSTQEWVYTVAPGLINNVLERHKANYAATTTTSEYYQYDHRGNVAAVTDSTGKILRGYQYDAFGNIPFSFATGYSGAAPTDDILFTGKDLDPDTGLYYFNARWYDSTLGIFLSREPIASQPNHILFRIGMSSIALMAFNSFLRSNCMFVGQNPMTRVDLDGRFWWIIGGAIGGGIISGIANTFTGGSFKCGAIGGAVTGGIAAAIPGPVGACLGAALGAALTSFCNCGWNHPQGGWWTLAIATTASCVLGASTTGDDLEDKLGNILAGLFGDIFGGSIGTIGEGIGYW
jgi:RHS repeat-associated protein